MLYTEKILKFAGTNMSARGKRGENKKDRERGRGNADRRETEIHRERP